MKQQRSTPLLTLSPIAAAILGLTLVSTAHAEGNSPSKLKAVTVNADADQETATGPVEGYNARRSATGSKIDVAIIEVPQTINVVTADKIEAIGATRVTEALSYTQV